MPSKKRKYNARFPAGRIKKIMQTDEEVGKVAQAVPIIIMATPRTLELFVESLLSKALQVTMSRNAKTLSPSHVKQCILAESRFDFLRDLVKNIPDVSVAEEKELQMSAESSPNSSRYSDTSVVPRRVVREDSNSSSSCDVRVQPVQRETLTRALSAEVDAKPRIETVTTIPATVTSATSVDAAIDLTKKRNDKQIRTANFYQETLVGSVQHKSVIKVNPTYSSPQPSTSSYTNLTAVEPLARIQVPKPNMKPQFYLDIRQNNNISMTPPRTPVTPITPILNIDFSKNLTNPEIKVLETSLITNVGKDKPREKLHRQNSKLHRQDSRKESKPPPLDIDHINSGNLQIDEDYDT